MMKINRKMKALTSVIMACIMCVGVLLSMKSDVMRILLRNMYMTMQEFLLLMRLVN